MTVALISRAPAIKTRFFRYINLSSIRLSSLMLLLGLPYLSFDISQAEPLIRRGQSHGIGAFLGTEPGAGKGNISDFAE